MNFLNLAETNAPFSSELIEAASNVIRSGCYLHGTQTKAFEEELAAQCGAKFAIGVSNGLDALRLIIRSYLELGRLHKGDGVMVASNTYIATVIPITEFGLIPVFVEPDEDTMNFSWSEALRILEENKRATSPLNISCAMITHLYGTPCWDLSAAKKMHECGMLIVEDNAQAIGAEAAESGLNGVHFTGNLADAAAFSFYPTKNIGALGDAGAVVTNDIDLAQAVKALANYGTDRRYHNLYTGYNCRLDEIQAAMLRVKLRHLKEETEHRNRIVKVYADGIKNDVVTLPKIFPDMLQVWHQYVICVSPEERDRLREYLKENGVPTDIHYPDPPYLQPCYIDEYGPKQETKAILLSKSCISLPIANVTEAEAAEIANIINSFAANS
ncbi:MAG: DegT/DnrJ/EryC1/StrS family aminotransferase [Muribaculaceae bacterium]|nr:DegT/DnrJ/EryC1/StrS family aminotransferase [Muribaculaceae bacterium]